MTFSSAVRSAPPVLRALFGSKDAGVAIVLLVTVMVMIVPLPALALDVLIALNLAVSIGIILISVYVQQPMEFSVFPAILLLVTLFRLSVNIALARSILLSADAGRVVATVGSLVLGGSYVVGIVIFLTLLVIQFVVITNGAGRVAEVAARFTLDAMPGKQMTIDADMGAGVITEPEARRRRRALQREADFYGAMDGASKFVRGDAIAAILIVAINIIGGFLMGVFQGGLSLMESLRSYTLVTVGAGLIIQIPALLISTAAALLVSRANSDDGFSSDLGSQLGNTQALAIASCVVLGLAFMPGFPTMAFLAVGGSLGGLTFFVWRQQNAAPELPALNPEQVAAVATIAAAFGGYAAFLLHGITGSGKTEVYLRLIEQTLAQGRQALMLVPEIALTPQLEGRVAQRFPQARVVSAHSAMPDAARARGFLDALEGRADILLGTRLAVFAPLPRLGLIVVDEEHDASFKQQEGLRYSARDVAVWRAHERGVPIVLGSATPSLETFHHARPGGGRYRLLELTQRAVAIAPPTVRCIDTRREKLQDGMSAALLAAISTRLERGEQSLIFLNRRGYAPVLVCPACGWVSRCRRCAANLVVHLADKRLRCHHCGCEETIPGQCPGCGNVDIHPFGRGTQRLEETLAARFPAARILRVDRDSASTPAKWQAILETIHGGGADLLIGTQMLAKGHDFPMLTLVGVVGADAALFAADFRAPERLFS